MTEELDLYSHEYSPDRTCIKYMRLEKPMSPAIVEVKKVSMYEWHGSIESVLAYMDQDIYSTTYRNITLVSFKGNLLGGIYFIYVYIQNEFLHMFPDTIIKKCSSNIITNFINK